MSWNSVDYTKEAAEQVEKENSFEPVPAGWYECFITKVDPNHVSSKKGTKGIELVFTVREEAHPEFKGRKIFDRIWMEAADGTPSKAQQRAVVLASKLGIPNAQLSPDTVIDMFYGKPVLIETEINSYQDQNGNDRASNIATYMGYKEAELGGRWTEPNPIEATSQGLAKDDPFANDGAPIDVNDEDLPF